ncbi:MAG: adenylate/guanylate cyclase domain-containing protein [Terriglobia bacterium]
MTIRRKLGLSFGTILLVLGFNLAIYFATRAKRNQVVDELGRATQKQALISTIGQTLDNIQHQVALFSSIDTQEGISSLSPEQKKTYALQLEETSQELRQLEDLADRGERSEIHKLQETYDQLAKSWMIYFENYGVHNNVALTEQALRGDPLSEEVLKNQVPHLVEIDKQQVVQAETEFRRVSRINDQLTIVTFLVSGLLSLVIAIRVSRSLARAIGDLILGTAHLSTGNLDYRIPVASDDEFGQLAQSFNGMTTSLGEAKQKVQQHTQSLERTNEELANKKDEIEKQKQFSEKLLLNILPAAVADELKAKGTVSPKYFEDVTILFTDFVGFTKTSEKLSVEDLVHLLHDFFTSFDHVMKKYNLEKLKTIGDSYMCAGGIPNKTSSHPVDAVLAAFDIVEAVAICNQRSRYPFAIRIGINTGPVAAGVVGIDKFAFDVWGDTVNFAARLQTASEPNRINVSSTTYHRIKDFFDCEFRGQIQTKEKKLFDMFFANGLHPDLQNGNESGFDRRYRIYFSKDPPNFPANLLARVTSVDK